MRIEIIEHDPLVRKLLELLAAQLPDLRLEQPADVILLTARELGRTASLRHSNPAAKIAVMTNKPDFRYPEAARAAGADGFWYPLPESAALHRFLLAVMAGEKPFPETVPVVMLGNAERSNITNREMEVLRQIVSGKTDTQIGEALGVSVPTVKHHIQQLRLKTGLVNRTQLAAEAVGCGLIDTALNNYTFV